jgi:hypothetical protein
MFRTLAKSRLRRYFSGVPFPSSWEKLCVADLPNGKSPESLIWNSPEGIPVKPLYTSEDIKSIEVPQIPGQLCV